MATWMVAGDANSELPRDERTDASLGGDEIGELCVAVAQVRSDEERGTRGRASDGDVVDGPSSSGAGFVAGVPAFGETAAKTILSGRAGVKPGEQALSAGFGQGGTEQERLHRSDHGAR